MMSSLRVKIITFVALIPAFTLLLSIAVAGADEWPGFRGPYGTGISKEKNLPVKWGPEENVAWKTSLPGRGASSPIIWGDRVFVNCWSGYAEDNGEAGDMKNLRRHLVCVDRKSGKILWKTNVKARVPEAPYIRSMRQHGYATNTAVTDGKRVYAFYGKTGVYAYDFAGKELWKVDVGQFANSFGTGASLVLWKDLLIVNASVEGARVRAFNKVTGKEVWKVRVRDDSWSTPLVVITADDRQELIVFRPTMLYGYDPATGKELWKCECEEPGYVSSNPVARDGIVYVMGTSSLGRVCMAVKTGGRGDVTKTHVVWKEKVGASYTSPILAGPNLYFFSRFAYCLNAKTGKEVFRERLRGLGSEYSSPVTADGKIYFFTRSGIGHVLAVGDKLKPLAQNTLSDYDEFVASPAISRGQIFVRTHTHLYCIGAEAKDK